MSKLKPLNAGLRFRNNRQARQLQLIRDCSDFLQRCKAEMQAQEILPTWSNFTQTEKYKTVIGNKSPQTIDAAKKLWEAFR